jgi:hypothetical protein
VSEEFNESKCGGRAYLLGFGWNKHLGTWMIAHASRSSSHKTRLLARSVWRRFASSYVALVPAVDGKVPSRDEEGRPRFRLGRNDGRQRPVRGKRKLSRRPRAG